MFTLNNGLLKTRSFRGVSCIALLAVIAIAIPSFALDPKVNHVAPLSVAIVPTIEYTNYPIPSNAIFVDQGIGKTTNTGAIGSPVPTLGLALSKASSGQTIVVASGIYREGDLSISKNITIQAAPNSQVWFDGTVVTTNWVQDSAGGFKLSNSPSSTLCNDRPSCLDNLDQIDPAYPMSWSPQMVFVDDALLNEVDTRAKAASGNNFFYDIATNTIYIGVNPTGKKVEVTNKRKFADLSSATATLRGIGIRRYGSILNPNKVQGSYHGAALQVAQGGNGRPTGTVIENNTFFQNSSRGMFLSYSDDAVIKGNAYLSNGHNGLDIYQSDRPLVEKNLIRGNNISKYSVTSGGHQTLAGSKMVKTRNGIVRDNVVEYNNGTGIWCDIECVGMKYYRNLIHSNTKHGIFYELSDNGTIASNLIYENGGEGVKIASSNTKIVHNTFFNNGNNIGVFEDPRTPSADPYGDTRNTTIINNILASGTNSKTNRLLEINGFNNPDSVVPTQMVTELNYNAYYRESANSPATAIGYRGASVSKTYANHAAAKNDGIEPNGIGFDGTSNPLFVDRQNFNFQLSPNSAAVSGGKVLSGNLSYIADDLNLAKGQSLRRGAISWQAMGTPTGTQPTVPPTPPTVPPTPPTVPPTPPTVPPTPPTVPPTPPTAPPAGEKLDIAIRKLMSDHNLAKVRVTKWSDPQLKARAYFKSSGWLHVGADIVVTIDEQGNYKITDISWIFSFSPIP